MPKNNIEVDVKIKCIEAGKTQAQLGEMIGTTGQSYAAMFVIGKSANGLTSWKDTDGHTLKSLESEE